MAFTATKQLMSMQKNSDNDFEEQQNQGNEISPLEMVRFAMLQLENLSKKEILDDQHTIPNVTSMLQARIWELSVLKQINGDSVGSWRLFREYRRGPSEGETNFSTRERSATEWTVYTYCRSKQWWKHFLATAQNRQQRQEGLGNEQPLLDVSQRLQHVDDRSKHDNAE